MTIKEQENPLRATKPFQLFGMGKRRKFLYCDGCLRDAVTWEQYACWDVQTELFQPEEYAVVLETKSGEQVRLFEDEQGVWLNDAAGLHSLSAAPVALPRFEGRPHAGLLRALHQEILVNVTLAGPLPNFLIYHRPWYRDAAMMMMCLEQTGNVAVAADWISGLRDPFDRNNAGHCEPDNLGQALYLASLAGGAAHPLVRVVLDAIPQFQCGSYIVGSTDFAEHSVYQTKWLKYGLARLGLNDPFEIPNVYDSYDSLFWMDYRDQHVPGPRFEESLARDYPYLRWAEAHFYGDALPIPALEPGYPITWEINASQADYTTLERLSPAYAGGRIGAPHTWHAAEMMLYLLDWEPGSALRHGE